MNPKIPLYSAMDANSPNEEKNFFIKELIHAYSPNTPPMPLHRHPFYEMIFVVEGEGVFTIDFKEYPLQKGALYLFSPAQMHIATMTNNLHMFLLRFDLSVFHEKTFFDNLSIFNFDVLDIQEPDYSSITSLLFNLHEEFNTEKTLKQLTLSNLLKLFLIKIQRLLPEVVNSPIETTLFSSLNQLLQQNNYKIANPSCYAKKLKVSIQTLNQAVKEFTSMPCGDYIRSKTIVEAKRLLSYTTMNASEIACELGFVDTGYFSRFFKRETGFSPISFRKNTI